jgi:transcription elongation factor Elf1
MDRIGDLTTLARKTPCPECGNPNLDFTLRCDLSYGACLYSANCTSCGASLEIVTGESAPDGKVLTDSVAPCPKCGDTSRIATLHCEISSRSCVYTLECATCTRA